MDSFWDGFEKQALKIPEYTLGNAMIAGVPLGLVAGAAGKSYYNRHPEHQERMDNAPLSEKRIGIHPALTAAAIGPAVSGTVYGLHKGISKLLRK